MGALAAVVAWYLLTQFAPQPPIVTGYGTSFANLFLEKTIISFLRTISRRSAPSIHYNNENVEDFRRIFQGNGTTFVAFDDPQQVTSHEGLVIFPMVAVSVIPIVHFMDNYPPQLPRRFVMTPEQLVGVYNGTITRFCNMSTTLNPEWNQFICEKESVALTAYHRVMPSGTNYLFTSALGAFSPAWAAAYPPGLNSTWYGPTQTHVIDSNNEMISAVAFHPYSIGYVPVPDFSNGIYSANVIPVDLAVQLPNGERRIVAGTDVTTLRAAVRYASTTFRDSGAPTWWNQSLTNLPCDGCWPIAGFSYITLKKNYESSKGYHTGQIFATTQFFRFTVEEGVRESKASYANPVDKIRDRSMVAIDSIRFDNGNAKQAVSIQYEIMAAAVVAMVAVIAATIRMTVPLCRQVVRVGKDGRITRMTGDDDAYSSSNNLSLMRQILENDTAVTSPRGPVMDDTLRKALIDTGELVISRQIGKGASGDVFLGSYFGAVVAIKRILLPTNSDRMSVAETFVKEASMMAQMRHPNIVQFLGASISSPYLYLITEYCAQGSLYDVLHGENAHKFNRQQKCAILIDAALGIMYLHGKGIVHRDIKTHNLLVDRMGTVKVADFGTSAALGFNFRASGSEKNMKTMVGTPEYVAPEVVTPKSVGYTYKADIYSFGIVAWEVWSGQQPYNDMAFIDIIFGVTSNGTRPPITAIDEPKLAKLIQRCWDKEPLNRPQFEEILTILREINDEESME